MAALRHDEVDEPEEITRVGPSGPCVAVRSTMILASLKALRRRGCLERYLSLIDPGARDPLLALAAPVWVPIALAEAHYAACDALALKTAEMLSIGSDVARIDASGAHVLIGLARAGGADVWSLLDRLPANWRRMYQGGTFRTIKAGPKEAKVQVEGNRLARFSYWRMGLRGIGEGLFGHFCARVYIRDTTDPRTDESASYVISWA